MINFLSKGQAVIQTKSLKPSQHWYQITDVMTFGGDAKLLLQETSWEVLMKNTWSINKLHEGNSNINGK